MPEAPKTLSIIDYNHLCAQSSKNLKLYCHNIRSFKCNASKSLCNFSNVYEIPDDFLFTETSFNDGNLHNINNFQSFHTLRSTGWPLTRSFDLCQKPLYSRAYF